MGRSEATRARLRAAALELFVEHGFEATTVSQVAAAAGVSHMTFFRHFATKEDVVMDDPYDEVIAEAVLAQDRRLPALERVRRGIATAWDALPEPGEAETHARVRLIAGHRGLMARAWENNRRTGELVVDALVADGADPLEASVAAGACLAALMEALLRWGLAPAGRELGPLVRQSLAYLAVVPVAPTGTDAVRS
ncbi:TetR/AcrR family transcriptional regulator [Cellulomonas sp. S1-8]|uniref:TetR/AcrR family transcriptional regulator n=1 Tax=Cellulomonas sp. S1-8 TaxID=2904790 RepID=UPI002244EBC2|nr:TetR/AcrR family transcriptional regulator [Cellulomonas sp. S1-8]UZN05140.1 TetR/AcrR family transcriptional regulator [Cellulomonas sp. S1-8]